MTIYRPDLVYLGSSFRRDLSVAVDEATGRIARIALHAEQEDANVVRLPGRALMPGFVNAHSHAFQRVIRGRTQWRPADDSVSDFWSWRQAMYGAVLRLTPEELETVSRFCFIEMLRAGITTVGEFHYVHNDPAGERYADASELARRVLAAAAEAGIRICLLNVCYATGGIGQPLGNGQRRFATRSLDGFMKVTGALADSVSAEPLVTVGVAPHSVRAVPRDWITVLHTWATRRDMPFHMHVSEQPAEVAASVAAYGARPVELLDMEGVLDARFTGVHATHITDTEVQLLARSGATVCACPGTERDLGDGILRAADLLGAGASIALGTDSQTIIDMLEEMRLVEYHERLRRLERVILADPLVAGEHREPAPALLRMATQAGARSLRVNAGMLEADAAADMIAIDLDHISLAGWTDDTLPAMVSLCGGSDVVSDVWVAGRRVVADRHHEGMEEAMESFGRVATRLAAGV